MFDLTDTYSCNPPMSFASYPIVKPNIRTGEGRTKIRGRAQVGDLKKKQHRKMAKKSRRANRR